MTLDNKSYSQKIVESGVLNNSEDEQLSTSAKLEKYRLTRTTYYDYMKFKPLFEVLVLHDLSKKQCFDLLANYTELLKNYNHKEVIGVIKEKFGSSNELMIDNELQAEVAAQLEKENKPFNTVEKLIKNHYHTADVNGLVLPLHPRVNVTSNIDMQLFAISQWSINAKNTNDVKAIVDQLKLTNPELNDIIECSTPYELILSVASRIWVGKRKENDVATIFRASELLITSKSLLAKAIITMLIKGYDSQIRID